MKKKIIIILLIAIYLTSCYFIGQTRNKKNSDLINEQEVGIYDDVTTEQLVTEKNSIYQELEFEGNISTDDNPWNITAGTFEMDNEGTCIFLTPNTNVKIPYDSSDTEIIFEYRIHPWVCNNSDGAGLIVTLFDENDSIIYESNIDVNNNDTWTKGDINFKEYGNIDSIQISCNNGKNNDDSNDWVVIKILKN